ncbi:hypothetical protein DAPPUDRAFT_97953 [Daphnia pulex]|uniref:Uncharacterized protein n=1 Tax=Daphnia pulex TaxID=6669 RepID=E9G316_DAPPU|nr:hypothetical protein DAPPUDRAFT_97953 [Daphnia pulex]|eukprot:EFX86408.1 hypothetical protein DAPPUDRAFT_97953 [Daphnia pulex]
MARDTVYTIPSLANSNFSQGFHGFHARLQTYLHSDVSETVPHRRQRERDSGTLYTIKQLELTYVPFADSDTGYKRTGGGRDEWTVEIRITVLQMTFRWFQSRHRIFIVPQASFSCSKKRKDHSSIASDKYGRHKRNSRFINLLSSVRLCFGGVLIPIWNAAKDAISKSMLLVLRSSNIARGLIGQKRMVLHVYTCDRAP